MRRAGRNRSVAEIVPRMPDNPTILDVRIATSAGGGCSTLSKLVRLN